MKILPNEALAQHIAVLGKTGAGKSSVMRGIVEGLLDSHKPVCVIDPKGDWWGLKSSADGKSAGYPVMIFGGEHADIPINAHAGAAIAELVATGNRPCIVDLGGWMVGERTRFFIDFASAIFKHSRGPRYLVVDEVHNFAPQGKVLDPDAGKMLHWANRLASEGRGKGITIFAASQRPQKVHKDFLTSCETLIAMRVIHPLDRGAIKDWIDGCPDPVKGKEVLNSLASMPRGTGWVWSPEIGFGPERIAFPLFKTYDSFKPQAHDTGKLKGWAEVDLEEVKSKLATVMSESLANDPKRLRARIAELERTKPTQVVDTEASAREYRRGKIDGYGEGVNAVRGELSALNTAMTMFDNARQAFNSAMQTVEKWRERPPSVAVAPIQRQPTPVPVMARAASTQLTAGDKMGRAERLVLIALAQYPKGRSKTQIALLTGYAGNGGSFNNALGALRSRGLAEGRGDLITITDSGLAALGTYEPLPTGSALLEHWKSKLGKAERSILDHVARHYPNALTKLDVGMLTGYEPNGGSFNNAIGRLRTLELINPRGDLRASDDLFDGA